MGQPGMERREPDKDATTMPGPPTHALKRAGLSTRTYLLVLYFNVVLYCERVALDGDTLESGLVLSARYRVGSVGNRQAAPRNTCHPWVFPHRRQLSAIAVMLLLNRHCAYYRISAHAFPHHPPTGTRYPPTGTHNTPLSTSQPCMNPEQPAEARTSKTSCYTCVASTPSPCCLPGFLSPPPSQPSVGWPRSRSCRTWCRS